MALERISYLSIILALALYSGILTRDRIFQTAYKEGYNAGGQAGYQAGIQEGRKFACMEKPI